MTKDEALRLALEALETKGEHHPRVYAAITAIKAALAQPAQEWSWVCNECGAKEFTSALSEADLEYLACAGCGCNEFHKAALAQPAQEPVAFDNCRAERICRSWCGNSACASHWVDATPQQRPWVGLTQDEVLAIGKELGLKCRLGGNTNIDFDYAEAIEAKLKGKNFD